MLNESNAQVVPAIDQFVAIAVSFPVRILRSVYFARHVFPTAHLVT